MLYFWPWIYVFAPQNEQWRVCPPQNYGEMQTLPRKIMKPLFFAPQNYGSFILCPALWSNADFAPQNHRDIVLGAKITTEVILKIYILFLFSNHFCKSMLFQRSIKPVRPVFKLKICCVMVPLRHKNIFKKKYTKHEISV